MLSVSSLVPPLFSGTGTAVKPQSSPFHSTLTMCYADLGQFRFETRESLFFLSVFVLRLIGPRGWHGRVTITIFPEWFRRNAIMTLHIFVGMEVRGRDTFLFAVVPNRGGCTWWFNLNSIWEGLREEINPPHHLKSDVQPFAFGSL